MCSWLSTHRTPDGHVLTTSFGVRLEVVPRGCAGLGTVWALQLPTVGSHSLASGSYCLPKRCERGVGQLKDGTDESRRLATNKCGEFHLRPMSNDTANRAPITDRGAR